MLVVGGALVVVACCLWMCVVRCALIVECVSCLVRKVCWVLCVDRYVLCVGCCLLFLMVVVCGLLFVV